MYTYIAPPQSRARYMYVNVCGICIHVYVYTHIHTCIHISYTCTHMHAYLHTSSTAEATGMLYVFVRVISIQQICLLACV